MPTVTFQLLTPKYIEIMKRIVCNTVERIIYNGPRGGGTPWTSLNRGETKFLSDAMTPSNWPSSFPSNPSKDHELLS